MISYLQQTTLLILLGNKGVIMKKNPIQTAETKEKLKNAFWELYSIKNIEHIKVKEITDLAGYNRGTFYAYYKDVYEVLENIQQEIFDGFNKNFEGLLDFIRNPENSPSSLLQFINLYEQYHKYLKILLSEKGNAKFLHDLKKTVKSIFYRKFNLDEVRDQVTLNYILEYIISAQIGLVTYWFSREKDIPIESILSLTHDMVFKGSFKVLLSLTENVGIEKPLP